MCSGHMMLALVAVLRVGKIVIILSDILAVISAFTHASLVFFIACIMFWSRWRTGKMAELRLLQTLRHSRWPAASLHLLL